MWNFFEKISWTGWIKTIWTYRCYNVFSVQLSVHFLKKVRERDVRYICLSYDFVLQDGVCVQVKFSVSCCSWIMTLLLKKAELQLVQAFMRLMRYIPQASSRLKPHIRFNGNGNNFLKKEACRGSKPSRSDDVYVDGPWEISHGCNHLSSSARYSRETLFLNSTRKRRSVIHTP